MAQARILVADDHPALLAEVTRLLTTEHAVVGEAHTGLEVLDAVPRLDPDLILLDISMPGMGGFEAARGLRQAGCRSKMVYQT